MKQAAALTHDKLVRRLAYVEYLDTFKTGET